MRHEDLLGVLGEEQFGPDESWQEILDILPGHLDLTESASELGAFKQARGIRHATDVLRMGLMYGHCDFSLREVAAWMKQQDIADVSNVAVLKRLRQSEAWFAYLLGQVLLARVQHKPTLARRIRLFDASSLQRPGAKGTDFRLHLGFDLSAGRIDVIEITDASGGESLTRYPINPGDVVIADAGNGHRRGVAYVKEMQADVLVRIYHKTFPVIDEAGKPVHILQACRAARCGKPIEVAVRTRPEPKKDLPAVAGRLLILKKSREATRQARKRLKREYNKKGKRVTKQALEAAQYVVLFTTLPKDLITVDQLFELYRMRWQIELVFKRLKSLLNIDGIRAQQPRMVRVYLSLKLIGALIIEDIASNIGAFSPWGGGKY